MWEHTPTYLTTKRNRTMKNDNNETYREMEKRLNRNHVHFTKIYSQSELTLRRNIMEVWAEIDEIDVERRIAEVKRVCFWDMVCMSLLCSAMSMAIGYLLGVSL